MKKLFSSVQFSHSVKFDSLWPHELQHSRSPCPSPTPGVHLNPCPLSRWCHPTISSSVVPFSSCPQSFPASGSFPMSQLFASGGQSIGVSASASVLLMHIQDWFPLELIDLNSLQSKGLSRVFSTPQFKSINFGAQLSLWSSPHIHPHISHLRSHITSLVAQLVKNLPAMRDTWVWSLGWEDPLEKGLATHSSIVA